MTTANTATRASTTTPKLIGMVHLPPLPGSPGSRLAVEAIVEHALTDATVLRDAGFDAIMTENFGDAPFTRGSIAPETVATMAIVIREIRRATDLPVGVNCLRNDARSALGIAAAVGARFIRVNVLTGVAATDQGMIEGDAHSTLRERERLCPDVQIFADVHVKHAITVNQPDIALAAEETAYRGRADAVIVSGSTTGRAANADDLKAVKDAVPDKPVLIGSGATADTIRGLLAVIDGVIVGSALKPNGLISAPIDRALADAFIRAAK